MKKRIKINREYNGTRVKAIIDYNPITIDGLGMFRDVDARIKVITPWFIWLYKERSDSRYVTRGITFDVFIERFRDVISDMVKRRPDRYKYNNKAVPDRDVILDDLDQIYNQIYKGILKNGF